MTRLLHDRYYAYADAHAWDLATGDGVRIGDVETAYEGEPAPAALIEVIEHGRDGEPRWLMWEVPPGQRHVMTERVAEAARARGCIPVAADLYLRLRLLLKPELEHRALVLIARPGSSIETARAALVAAAAHSPRPHVLLSLTGAETRPPLRSDRVREARAQYNIDVARRMRPASLSDDVTRQIARAAKAHEFSRSGRHAAAERLLRDVSAALSRRRACVPAAQTLIALGRLVLERGRALDAERAFDEAAEQAHLGRDEPLSLAARIWQAAARTDAGQLTSAEALCRAAIVTGVLSPAERARADATLARILIWQGRVEDATAMDLSFADANDDATWFVGATAVRVLVAGGSLFQAGQRARDLFTRSEQSDVALARVMASMAHLRVLAACGDVIAAKARLADIEAAAREARTPLRLVRARLLVARLLRQAGYQQEADAASAQLRRLRRVVPPLLKHAIDADVSVDSPRRPAALDGRAAVTMVTLAQERENDRDSVRAILQFIAASAQTSRLDLWSSDAGPATVILSVGGGMSTVVGPRTLDAGFTIDSGDHTGGELGVAVRIGDRLIAALVARWPADRRRPDHARDLLELAAAAAAPRIDAMRAAARETVSAATAIPDLVGISGAIAEVRRVIGRAAAAPFAVLIEGESGVGKELVARAIHQLSARRERRFCDVNCAALPDDLLESELFGHARGAFTGAVGDRAGLIEEADGGTLFLDEVADLSLRAQAKLLRVLQQQEVRRVGETFSRKVDVRVVSAANRDVHAEAAASRFRSDLLYRLDVIRVRVPPLRERPEDIAVLAHHVWAQVAPRVETRAVLTHGLLAALSHYHWPGNVRELQNVMAALAVAAPARGHVRASLLPHAIGGVAVAAATRLAEARHHFERRFIEAALARAGGRRARAARELGLSRQGLLKLMVRLGIEHRTRLSSASEA